MLENKTRVKLNAKALNLPYVKSRKKYTNMYENKTGTVIGYSGTGKVAVEFDDVVFIDSTRLSNHDNGCHHKGRLHYCWYIPEDCLDIIGNNSFQTLDEDFYSIL